MTFRVETIRAVLDGRIPKQVDCAFGNVVERAKQLLDSVDFDRMQAQVRTLNWLISELGAERYDPPGLDSGEVDLCDQNESRPSLIRDYIAQIDLDPDVPFTWSQYFGLMALGIISGAMPSEDLEEDPEFDYDPLRFVRNSMWMRAIEAVEAVSIGEVLRDAEGKLVSNNDEHVKKEISLRNSKAAIQRHAQVNDLKDEFIRFYLCAKSPSRAEAARRFLKTLPEERRKLLKPSNAERTLLGALRAYERQQQARSES